MTLAELTVQLAREAGVDVRTLAADLARHGSTSGVAAQLVEVDRRLPPATRTSTPASSGTTTLPARAERAQTRPAPGGGSGPSATPAPFLSPAWFTEPLFWLPLPTGGGKQLGVSPAVLLLGYLAWRYWSDDGED